MTITNSQTGTSLTEIADRVYRISTPIPEGAVPIPGGFTFNQFLIAADEPLLFHTGMRGLFPLVSEAVGQVLPVDRLRFIGFSHHEADEDGSMDQWLAAAPRAQALCSRTAAMLQGNELARPPRALADGEELALGSHTVRWFDAPHVPHGWDCGFLGELRTRTLFCGDLFTQAGSDAPARTEGDILGPSEAMRAGGDYFAHAPHTGATIERLAAFEPHTLACMHGSSYAGDGARLLRALAQALVAA